MNLPAFSILLAEGGWIPLAVIVVVWLITAAASTSGKKTKPPPRAKIPKKGPMAQKPPRITTVQPPRKAGRPQKRPVAMPPPLPIETSVATTSVSQPAPPAESVASRSVPQAVSAAAIHNWMTPKTLRQQFILTELFQEPMALRVEDRSR